MQQTKVVLSEVMMPSHTNPSGNVHGGNIMKIMDSTAYALWTRRLTRRRGNIPARTS